MSADEEKFISERRYEKITEYIFAPFNTFVYLNFDEIRMMGTQTIKKSLLRELNRNKMRVGKDTFIEWNVEDSEEFKKSKGVFAAPGTDVSFLVAELVDKKKKKAPVPVKKAVPGFFKKGELDFSDVRFYFHEGGVATCSVNVVLRGREGLDLIGIEKVSESVNDIYKEHFEKICYKLAESYIKAVRKLNIPHFYYDFLPEIHEVDRTKHFIPWTHRIYHIHDDAMFKVDNPGEAFRALLTPSRHMDIKDLSIYDNRYIYFGWGHSIIFTSSQETEYSQTKRPVYDYVRLVEIAQANWQCIDVLTDIVDMAIASFNRHYSTLKIRDIRRSMDEMREFENGIYRVLEYTRGVKITFDTENRLLLKELNRRWLTSDMINELTKRLDRIRELLDQLYQRQKGQQDESLNRIVLLFTILGIAEVFGVIFAILQVYNISPLIQLVVLAIGTIILATSVVMYFRYVQKG